MFGNHTKKRPHNLVVGRCFDHHILDMMELGVDNFVPMGAFKGVSATLGSKPCFSFNGDLFETDGVLEAKSQHVPGVNLDACLGHGPCVTLLLADFPFIAYSSSHTPPSTIHDFQVVVSGLLPGPRD